MKEQLSIPECVVNRAGGFYYVRIESIFDKWKIAHWNKTFQFWSYYELPGMMLNDDFWEEINEERILMPDEKEVKP